MARKVDLRESYSGFSPRASSYGNFENSSDYEDDDDEEDLSFPARRPVFHGNARLALSVGIWSALFALPVCSQQGLHYTMFGSRLRGTTLIAGSNDSQMICNAAAIKGQTLTVGGIVSTLTVGNNASAMRQLRGGGGGGVAGGEQTEEEQLPGYDPRAVMLRPFDETLDGTWDPVVDPAALLPGDSRHIWCGYVPELYESYWPNVVQLMVFSVVCNTGTTVQFAWQGIIGTFAASLNAAILTFIFPEGGAGYVCDGSEPVACAPGEVRRNDPLFASYQWLIWVNIIVFYLIVFLSGAEENTMKFGLAWHTYFSMTFMSPSFTNVKHFQIIGFLYWDSERMIVNMTTIFGVILAIVATLTPPLLGLPRVVDASRHVIRGVDTIWSNSIDYYCGTSRSGKRLQIIANINSLSEKAASVAEDLDASWWESLDIGLPGRKRALFAILDEHVTGIEVRHVFYAVSQVVDDEDFSGKHDVFSKTMKTSMGRLRIETIHLMKLCEQSFEDGNLDDSEADRLNDQIERLTESQNEMATAYLQLSPKIDEEFMTERIFLFALSYWSMKMQRFAQEIGDGDVTPPQGFFAGLCSTLGEGFRSTWSPSTMIEPERLSFALRNWLSLTIAFVLGYCPPGEAIFEPYSYGMAMTLCLLISHFSDSALRINLENLLGVVLGKILPIIMLMMLEALPCPNVVRSIGQLIAIVVFQFTFVYVFLSSDAYSNVGQLIAGFGVVLLMKYLPCGELEEETEFADKYKELGQMVVAIMIQLAIDSLFVRQSARDKAVGEVASINHEIKEGFESFFRGDLDAFRSHRDAAIKHLNEAIGMVPESDPKQQVAAGVRSKFKHDLYTDVLNNLKMKCSYMSVMLLACDGAEGDGADIMDFLRQRGGSSWSDMGDHVMSAVSVSLDALLALLQHDDESKIQEQNLNDIVNRQDFKDIDGKEALYASLQSEACEAEFCKHLHGRIVDGWRVRISVIVAALVSTMQNLEEINNICIQANTHI